MQCPKCGSADLDTTARCPCCGIQLSVREERELRAQMPLPHHMPVPVDEYAPSIIDEEVAA